MKAELKKYLLINALFSGLSGLLMLTSSAYLNTVFNINNVYVFPIIGINLIGFALFVWFAAVKKTHYKGLVNLISLLDALWVLGSFLIIAFQRFNLTSIGYFIMSLVALWVGFLGLKQYKNNN